MVGPQDVITLRPVKWDEAAVERWLERLAARPGDIVEVFAERLCEVRLDWRDGAAGEIQVRREDGTGARFRSPGLERFVFVPGNGEASVREAVRALRSEAGTETLPIRPARTEARAEPDPLPSIDRWTRRLASVFSRHAPRHRFAFRVRQFERRVVAPGRPAASTVRRLLSLEGRFTAASRLGDEERAFSFHAPDTDSAGDELRSLLAAAAAPRDRAVPPPSGQSDVVLGGGCAAVLFHEILGHPLEADAGLSPLQRLSEARVAASELEVVDDPKRLDLFGGYERDDEGTVPRTVRLVSAGRIGSKLTDRAHAAPGGSTGHGRRAGPSEVPLPRSSNIVVGSGQATPEEMARRLSNGLWIEEFAGGSLEMASGSFRLRFSRARRVRRGRLADELGPGILAGEILPTLGGVEPIAGREVRACRSLGWCARRGQTVPVQGAAPDILVRGLSVRPLP
jgi:predicted Zn-dependent protease